MVETSGSLGYHKRLVRTLQTKRLELLPITRELVDAVVTGDRALAEKLCDATFPGDIWPGRALVERAFSCPLEKLHEDPEGWLWGARVLVTSDARVVVGSVIVSGREGDVEVAYGVDGSAQGKGYATEGTQAVVDWALEQASVSRVLASTFPWHVASRRVLEKVGMTASGMRETEMFGDLVVYEKMRA